MRSIEVVIRELAAAVRDGKSGRTAKAEGAEEEESPRRRSSRSQFRAQDAPAAEAEGDSSSDAPAVVTAQPSSAPEPTT